MWFRTMADGLNFHCLRNLLLGCCQHRLTTDFGLKQCVHQSRLSQAALSCKHKHTDYTDYTLDLQRHPLVDKPKTRTYEGCAMTLIGLR